MAPIATADPAYYPAAFPDDLPQVDLARISVKDLLEQDERASETIYKVLCTSGFFYLDLTTDPRGEKFIGAANELHDAAKDVFKNVSVEDKETWKGDPLRGVLDVGYRAMGKDDDGQPNGPEVLNVPSNSVLYDPDFQLPSWLNQYRSSYQSFASQGNTIGSALFHILERELHLASGELTNMHKLGSETGGFVRIFRYPAPKDGIASSIPTGPAHTDGNSLTILFNWQGGLQIVRPKKEGSRGVKMIDGASADEEWLWLKPIPGHVIVNLGDPMVTFSNGVLTSGRHRVVDVPGEQSKYHRYSVLMGMRPASSTPMRALKSDIIPLETEEQRSRETVTAIDWAVAKVRDIMERAQRKQG